MRNDNFAYDISLNSERTSRRNSVVPIAVNNINRMKGKPEKSLRASTELEPVVYALLSTAVICQLGYDH